MSYIINKKRRGRMPPDDLGSDNDKLVDERIFSCQINL